MLRLLLLFSAVALLDCSSSEPASSPAPAASSPPAASSSPPAASSSPPPAPIEPPGCERTAALEPDFKLLSSYWIVPLGQTPAPTLPEPGPDGYVVAATRLNLRPDVEELFMQHNGAIFDAIRQQPGFVGLQVGRSSQCGVARTMSVWQDEAAMYAFVVSDAHKAAMKDMEKISRGLSNTTHFTAAHAADISWAAAAQAIAADDGPFR